MTSRARSPSRYQRLEVRTYLEMSAREQHGVSLLEILIALLVLSVGLLGLAALQSGALQGNQASLMHAKATNLAYDITDRMRANRGNRDGYERDFSDFEDEIANTCNPNVSGDDLHDADVKQWKAAIRCSLPGGQGSISHDNDGVTTVTIQWIEGRLDTRNPANPGWETLRIDTRI